MANRKKAVLDQGTIRIFIEMAVLFTAIIVLLVLIGNANAGSAPEETTPSTEDTLPSVETVPVDTSPEGIFQAFLREHNLSKEDYTDTMIEDYALYPECREFILNYPLEKDKEHTPDIS